MNLRWVSAIVLAAMACGDSSPLTPPPLPPLESQTWFVHASEAQPLPAMIGHRSIGIALRFDSMWLQNHFMVGEFGGTVLRMQHGLSHGDAPVPFSYAR